MLPGGANDKAIITCKGKNQRAEIWDGAANIKETPKDPNIWPASARVKL